ncbi:hypothetical protein NT6N_32050 [Oceaniferula spumae]|uniref:Uncharacterized protein n=1 Tax=Oceaniferula spumae TaxID=2979115 RepID=A0AAT9FQF2_9BACT
MVICDLSVAHSLFVHCIIIIKRNLCRFFFAIRCGTKTANGMTWIIFLLKSTSPKKGKEFAFYFLLVRIYRSNK